MKIVLAISSCIILLIGCNAGKSRVIVQVSKDSMTVITNFIPPVPDFSEKKSDKNIITLTVSYAAIECGCPQWFETRYQGVKYLDGVERFYLELVNKSLVDANNLWDGVHLPLTIKMTGRFSKEKEYPKTYHTKGVPEKAKIFWYKKIEVIPRASEK